MGRRATTTAEEATTTINSSSSSSVTIQAPVQGSIEDDDASITATSTLPPLVHVRLDSQDLIPLYNDEPSIQVLEAWTYGLAMPSVQERRLLLQERSEGRRRLGRMGTQQLYSEGREWWEERCAGRGAKGRDGV